MGRLRLVDGEREFPLSSRSIVGRAPASDLRLDDPTVSGEHARFAWTGSGWTVRDLASRNGTTVDGEAIAAGLDVDLVRGARLSFGLGARTGEWELVDDGPPRASARRLAGAAGEGERYSEAGLLALPHPSEAALLIYRQGVRWLAESSEGEVSSVVDGETVDVAGKRFRLSLPAPLVETSDARIDHSIHEAELVFFVSRDGEHVELEVVRSQGATRLPPRSYQQTLLVLATARLNDREGVLSESECGWLYTDHLARMVGREPAHVNVDVFRARREFASLGFPNAPALIERRSQSRQLRIGCPNLRIRAL